MSSAEKLLEEIYDKWSEHLEHLEEEDILVFLLNATADMAIKQRDRADRLLMDLRRCEINRR